MFQVLVVNAPGHLPDHIILLVHTGPNKYIYLAGDACHDDPGHNCCIKADKRQTENTIGVIRQLESDGIEVILAHDHGWEENPENRDRFFGTTTTGGGL